MDSGCKYTGNVCEDSGGHGLIGGGGGEEKGKESREDKSVLGGK